MLCSGALVLTPALLQQLPQGLLAGLFPALAHGLHQLGLSLALQVCPSIFQLWKFGAFLQMAIACSLLSVSGRSSPLGATMTPPSLRGAPNCDVK